MKKKMIIDPESPAIKECIEKLKAIGLTEKNKMIKFLRDGKREISMQELKKFRKWSFSVHEKMEEQMYKRQEKLGEAEEPFYESLGFKDSDWEEGGILDEL